LGRGRRLEDGVEGGGVSELHKTSSEDDWHSFAIRAVSSVAHISQPTRRVRRRAFEAKDSPIDLDCRKVEVPVNLALT
jgi:hypothetical protein